MKRALFTLITAATLLVGHASADMIETTTQTTMGTVPMLAGTPWAGTTYSITGDVETAIEQAGGNTGVHTWTVGDRYKGGSPSSTFSKTFMFSQPIPISFIAARFQDMDVSDGASPAVTVTVMGGTADTADLVSSAGVGGTPLGYTPATGVFMGPAGTQTNNANQLLSSSMDTLTKLTLTSNQNDALFYAFGFNKKNIMSAVPEPSSLLFMGLIVTGVGIRRRYVK